MKLDRPLSPSLETIERRLFGVSEALLAAVEEGRVSPAIAEAVRHSPEWAARSAADDAAPELPDSTVPPMPAHIRHGIERMLAARGAFGSERRDPAPGQIVEVREISTPRPGQLDWVMQVPLYVLLDTPAELASVWHGWLVSAEADYAGWWDFVLQQEDMPFDPEAAVVHLGNPVRIYLPMTGRVVAELSRARLQSVRALAAEYVAGGEPVGVPVWPGRVALRETVGGLPVVTGSPLGGEDDPRHRFQHLYFHAAEAIREPARLAMAEQVKVPVPTLVSRLLVAAGGLAGHLVPVPRVELAMGKNDSQSGSGVGDEPVRDLLWEGIARISIREVDSDGSGMLLVSAVTEISVICELRVAGVIEDKVTASGGADPVKIVWEGAERPVLVIEAEDGRRLELPLVP